MSSAITLLTTVGTAYALVATVLIATAFAGAIVARRVPTDVRSAVYNSSGIQNAIVLFFSFGLSGFFGLVYALGQTGSNAASYIMNNPVRGFIAIVTGVASLFMFVFYEEVYTSYLATGSTFLVPTYQNIVMSFVSAPRGFLYAFLPVSNFLVIRLPPVLTTSIFYDVVECAPEVPIEAAERFADFQISLASNGVGLDTFQLLSETLTSPSVLFTCSCQALTPVVEPIVDGLVLGTPGSTQPFSNFTQLLHGVANFFPVVGEAFYPFVELAQNYGGTGPNPNSPWSALDSLELEIIIDQVHLIWFSLLSSFDDIIAQFNDAFFGYDESPRFFFIIAQYVWIGFPLSFFSGVVPGFTMQTLMRSPAFWRYGLMFLSNLPSFFSLEFRSMDYLLLDTYYDEVVVFGESFRALGGVIDAGFVQFLSAIEDERSGNTCSQNPSVFSGSGVCKLAFAGYFVSFFFQLAYYFFLLLANIQKAMIELPVGTLYSVSTRAAFFADDISICTNPAPDLGSFCDIPKNPAYLLDYAAYMSGGRSMLMETDDDDGPHEPCNRYLCNIQSCDSDADCLPFVVHGNYQKCDPQYKRCVATNAGCTADKAQMTPAGYFCHGYTNNGIYNVGVCGDGEATVPLLGDNKTCASPSAELRRLSEPCSCFNNTFRKTFEVGFLLVDQPAVFFAASLGQDTELVHLYGLFENAARLFVMEVPLLVIDTIIHIDLIADNDPSYVTDVERFMSLARSIVSHVQDVVNDFTETYVATNGDPAGARSVFAESSTNIMTGFYRIGDGFILIGKYAVGPVDYTLDEITYQFIYGALLVAGGVLQTVVALFEGDIADELQETLIDNLDQVADGVNVMIGAVISCAIGVFLSIVRFVAFLSTAIAAADGPYDSFADIFTPLEECWELILQLILAILNWIFEAVFEFITGVMCFLGFTVDNFVDSISAGECYDLNVFCNLYALFCPIYDSQFMREAFTCLECGEEDDARRGCEPHYVICQNNPAYIPPEECCRTQNGVMTVESTGCAEISARNTLINLDDCTYVHSQGTLCFNYQQDITKPMGPDACQSMRRYNRGMGQNRPGFADAGDGADLVLSERGTMIRIPASVEGTLEVVTDLDDSCRQKLQAYSEEMWPPHIDTRYERPMRDILEEERCVRKAEAQYWDADRALLGRPPSKKRSSSTFIDVIMGFGIIVKNIRLEGPSIMKQAIEANPTLVTGGRYFTYKEEYNQNIGSAFIADALTPLVGLPTEIFFRGFVTAKKVMEDPDYVNPLGKFNDAMQTLGRASKMLLQRNAHKKMRDAFQGKMTDTQQKLRELYWEAPTLDDVKEVARLSIGPLSQHAQAQRSRVVKHFLLAEEQSPGRMQEMKASITKAIFSRVDRDKTKRAIAAEPVESSALVPLDLDGPWEERDYPFDCRPGYTCFNCSSLDRAAYTLEDSFSTLGEYYSTEYIDRFMTCQIRDLKSLHNTLTDPDNTCPDEVCALRECRNDGDCEVAPGAAAKRCHPGLKRCVHTPDQCEGVIGSCAAYTDQAATRLMLGTCVLEQCLGVGGSVFKQSCECPDTWITVDRKIPSLWERFYDVTWPWHFNYTALGEYLRNGTSATVPATHAFNGRIRTQLACANLTDEEDANSFCSVLDFTDTYIPTLTNWSFDTIETTMFSISQSVDDSGVVLTNFLDRFVWADSADHFCLLEESSPSAPDCCNDRCEVRQQGTDLFSAIVVFAGLLVAIAVFAPGGTLLAAILILFSYSFIMMYAYGGGILAYVNGQALVVYLFVDQTSRLIRYVVTTCCRMERCLDFFAPVMSAILFAIFISSFIPGASVCVAMDSYTLMNEFGSPCMLPPTYFNRSHPESYSACFVADNPTVVLPVFIKCDKHTLAPSQVEDPVDIVLNLAARTFPEFVDTMANSTNGILAPLARRASKHTTETRARSPPEVDTCAEMRGYAFSLSLISFILPLIFLGGTPLLQAFINLLYSFINVIPMTIFATVDMWKQIKIMTVYQDVLFADS